jgi:uncharacterized RDD family membrane protein YckC
MLNCQNCDAPVEPSAERCEKCGAKLLHRRVIFNAPRPEDFNLTAEEPYEFKETGDGETWEFPERFEAPQGIAMVAEPARAPAHGGFFRRAVALLIDLFVIALLAAVMVLMAYLGYKVGLAAHQRALSGSMMMPLATLLTGACTFLSMAYFILFHGMEGKTPGKWLLGLRVVGPQNQRISYRTACLRFLVMAVFAPVLLGFLWVIWSREKRAWHDYVARTWVIRSEQ